MTEQKIIEIVEENIEKNCEVSLESHLIDDLGVDSLGIVILMNAFEDEFSIEIPDGAFKEINTVQDILVRIKEVVAS